MNSYNLPSAFVYISEDGIVHETPFEIPIKWFATSGALAHLSVERSQPVWLHSVTFQAFWHFWRWLHQDQIITYWHDPNNPAHGDSFHKLIAAVELGIHLESPEYQLAAMREFLSRATYLAYPEHYLARVWAVTECWADSEVFKSLTTEQKQQLVHPMRKVIVAIVAAKTVGVFDRDVVGRPGSCASEEEIPIADFWKMYQEYTDGFDDKWLAGCEMPGSVEQFL